MCHNAYRVLLLLFRFAFAFTTAGGRGLLDLAVSFSFGDLPRNRLGASTTKAPFGLPLAPLLLLLFSRFGQRNNDLARLLEGFSIELFNRLSVELCNSLGGSLICGDGDEAVPSRTMPAFDHLAGKTGQLIIRE